MRLLPLIFVIAVVPAAAGDKPSVERVPLFVRPAQNAEGFSDPSKDRKDSTKDVQRKLSESKTLTVAPTEAEAWAVIEVMDRETKRETNLMGHQNKSYLTVRLVAGTFTSEFTGESGSKGVLRSYGAAAGKIVDQLEAWVATNHERLAAVHRESAAAPAPAADPAPLPTPQP